MKGIWKTKNLGLQTYGSVGRKFYVAWASMKQRCLYEKHSKYNRYGGRGITVCDKWLTYKGFEDDMYEEYVYHLEDHNFNTRQTTLERIDNDGNYTKNNCKWATPKEQSKNRTSRKVDKNSILQKVKKAKLNYATVMGRINREGMTVEQAMSIPLKRVPKKICI